MGKRTSCKGNKIQETCKEPSSAHHLIYKRRLSTEVDDEIELIDLSNLTNITSRDDASLVELNRRVFINHPVKWEINNSGGSHKIYQDGSIDLNEKGSGPYYEVYPKCDTQGRNICSRYRAPPYRTITGQEIKPTQITSLLSQNPEGTSRPPDFCYLWDQTDEKYYRAAAKKGLPEFIAATRPNYYCIPEVSRYRRRFKCPKGAVNHSQRCGEAEHMGDVNEPPDDSDETCDFDGEYWCPPIPEWKRGTILIYVHPGTGQAEFYCPQCSMENSTKHGGDGKPVKHTVPRELRDNLAADGLIPYKEYKYKDRTIEIDTILALVDRNPGISYYRLDSESQWPKGTAKRVIETHLKGKVRVRQGKKGYRVYPA